MIGGWFLSSPVVANPIPSLLLVQGCTLTLVSPDIFFADIVIASFETCESFPFSTNTEHAITECRVTAILVLTVIRAWGNRKFGLSGKGSSFGSPPQPTHKTPGQSLASVTTILYRDG
jgi:hypothetical protein